MAAGVSALPILNSACSTSKKNEIGVQVYSVRNQLMANFEETIMAIGEMGFDYIEAYGLSTSGIFPSLITANQYERTVARAGMRVASTHCDYFTVEDAPVMIESARRLGVEYVIIPWLQEEQRLDYRTHAENFNQIGEQFKEAGIGFGYHNHDFEFFETENGEIPMEILLENTDPELVEFQADLYWIRKAGLDPLEFLKKYPGRFCSYHVKDANESLDQTTVGDGIIDFESILKMNDEFGIKQVFVEDERVDDPLGNIEAGHDFLRTLNY